MAGDVANVVMLGVSSPPQKYPSPWTEGSLGSIQYEQLQGSSASPPTLFRVSLSTKEKGVRSFVHISFRPLKLSESDIPMLASGRALYPASGMNEVAHQRPCPAIMSLLFRVVREHTFLQPSQ